MLVLFFFFPFVGFLSLLIKLTYILILAYFPIYFLELNSFKAMTSGKLIFVMEVLIQVSSRLAINKTWPINFWIYALIMGSSVWNRWLRCSSNTSYSLTSPEIIDSKRAGKCFFVLFHFVFRLIFHGFWLQSLKHPSRIKKKFIIVSVWDSKCQLLTEGFYELSTFVELEKTLESPLDCKMIKLVNPKGNQSWIFIGRTDAEAEAPIFWPLDAKNWLTGKDPDAGKDWRQEEKVTTEDEKVGWHHELDGPEFE